MGVEDASNKVTSISGSSTDTQYPSAKLVYDQLALKQGSLTAGTNINIANDGTISATDTTYNDFVGTDGTSAGTAGLVPAPATADAGTFLKADGTWAHPAGTVYTGGTRINISNSNVINTTAEINKIDVVKVDGNALTITDKAVNITGKENTSNKVTSLSSSSTDTQYPSAKLVYDQLATKQDVIDSSHKINADNVDDTNSTHKFTTASDITKLAGIATGAQVNVIETVKVDGTALTVTDKAVNITGKENTSNKVTSLSASSTDTQYPSAKLVYDQLALKEAIANKVTSLSSSSTNTQYPSAKLVYDQLALKLNIADLVALTNQEVTDIFDFELANS